MLNYLKDSESLKEKIKLVYNYLLANYRYKLYDSKFKFLIRQHIKEQYLYRLSITNKPCLYNGACVKCGCKIPQLQFSNLACEGYCYSEMLSKKRWEAYKELIKNDGQWKLD